MLLKMDESGKVLLAGEPIKEWFANRNITPIVYDYAGSRDGKPCMHLITAIAYATAIMFKPSLTPEEFIVQVQGMASPWMELAEMIDLHEIEAEDLENGWDDEGFDSDMEKLGQEARIQMEQEINWLDD